VSRLRSGLKGESLPMTLAILAGVAFMIFMLVQAAIWGFNLAEFAILIAVGIVGGVIGIYISWKMTRGFRERSKR